ncbi:hypothetical protein JTB14_005793 [Gonioctena quinquepunctata]|nr:hypothetical protein JTB14_005793 [Gonioctena quinquepunctata]
MVAPRGKNKLHLYPPLKGEIKHHLSQCNRTSNIGEYLEEGSELSEALGDKSGCMTGMVRANQGKPRIYTPEKNNKDKEIRQVKRKIHSSSDTESDNSINLDNDSDDDIGLQSLQDDEKIIQGDFVLVEFSSEYAIT